MAEYDYDQDTPVEDQYRDAMDVPTALFEMLQAAEHLDEKVKQFKEVWGDAKI